MIIKRPKMNGEKQQIFSYAFEVKRYSLIGEFWNIFKRKKTHTNQCCKKDTMNNMFGFERNQKKVYVFSFILTF